MKFLPLFAAFFTAATLLAQEPAAPPAPAPAPAAGEPAQPAAEAVKPEGEPANPPPATPRPTGPEAAAAHTVPPEPVIPPEEPLLPRPAGPVHDTANVLRPDAVERLTTALNAARTKDVWVYVLTLPTLRVPPSKQREKLESLAKRYAAAWAPKRAGAVLLFDDEGGLMALEITKEASNRFSDVAIQIELEERIRKLKPETLSREKLEGMGLIAGDVLSAFQSRYAIESARQHRTNLIMGALALLGVGLAVWSALASPEPRPTPETKPADAGTKPPTPV